MRAGLLKKLILLAVLTAVLGGFLARFMPVADVFAADKYDPEKMLNEGFAVLEITLNGFHEEDIHRSAWLPISYRLRWDGREIENTAQIKGRGNYTWEQAKRPYAIKCDKKTNWFGFGAAKDWVLLANFTDQTHLRNYLAYSLAAKMRFRFTPQTAFAQVFINGRYNGIYLVTEKVEIDDERLDISITGGDVLIELDNNYGWNEPVTFASPFGNLYVFKDPDEEKQKQKLEEAGGEGVTFSRAISNAQSHIKRFEDAVTTDRDLDTVFKYMDRDSLIDWLIFNELVKNDDTVFNSSIYLYNKMGDKLYMGPVWDYDLAMGGIDRFNNVYTDGLQFLDNPWDRPNWFVKLLNRDDFNGLVKERWSEIYASGILGDWVAELDRMAKILPAAVQYDVKKWDNAGVFVLRESYNEGIQNLRDFVTGRIEWLNSVWNVTGATPGPTSEPTPTPTPGPTPDPTATPANTPEPTPSRLPPGYVPVPPTAEPAEKPSGNRGYGSSSLSVPTVLATVLTVASAAFAHWAWNHSRRSSRKNS